MIRIKEKPAQTGMLAIEQEPLPMSLYEILASVRAQSTLMHRMMERFGVDRTLRRLPHRGEVTVRAVERCRTCGRASECAEWLDHNKQPEAPPEYCRNAGLIERLRRVAEGD